jgi:hypothetical protein
LDAEGRVTDNTIPKLTKNFAGVGSRDIESYNVRNKETGNWEPRKQYKGQKVENAAKQAIRDVYANTFKPTTQPSIKTANQTFEQLYSEQDRNTILGELRNKYKEQYNQLSDAELVQRINNRLVTSDREKTIELLNKCFKQ